MMHDAWSVALRDRLPWPRRLSDRGEVLDALMQWLARAQDVTGCGGVSAYYDLRHGRWAEAYPETTGYIIPTFFDYAAYSGREEYRERALKMADWETQIQLPEGAIQAGTLGAPLVVPTIFNTGQVIFGWARAYRETQHPSYANSMRRAADWLVSVQDEDGAWRKHPSPFARPGINAYNTRTAFALIAAAQALGAERYAEAAGRNVAWALSTALPNGWLPDNCLEEPDKPLTHTIAYSIRGILEVSAAMKNTEGLAAAVRMARGVAAAQRSDGSIPGRLDRQWQPQVRWSCMTGNAQMALVWMRLAEVTAEKIFRENATKAIGFCVRQIDLDSPNDGVRGGMKGSYPFDGPYMRHRYPNWATKFLADALLLVQTF